MKLKFECNVGLKQVKELVESFIGMDKEENETTQKKFLEKAEKFLKSSSISLYIGKKKKQ